MNKRIQFTAADFRTPESTERTMRQFEAAIGQQFAAVPVMPSTAALAAELAPAIRDQLQASGSAPLNLQSLLLPGQAQAVYLEDTHANRLTLYTIGQQVGAGFYETDRTVSYIAGATLAWQYQTGIYAAVVASIPVDLGTVDAGFLFYATDQLNLYRWSGSAWATIATRILIGGFYGIFTHANSADRTYTFPDATGTVALITGAGTKAPGICATLALTAQTAAITTTALANSSTAGTYRVSYSLQDTTADLAAGTIQLNIAFTDGAGATTVNSTALVLTALGRTTGVFYLQLASGSITYATTLVGLIGTATYALYLSLERLS